MPRHRGNRDNNPHLITLIRDGNSFEIDSRFLNVTIGNNLSNPFYETGAYGWCSCREIIQPDTILKTPINGGFIITCTLCGSVLAYTIPQIVALILAMSLTMNKKIDHFQRFKRSFIQTVNKTRRMRGRRLIEDLASSIRNEFRHNRPMPLTPHEERIRSQNNRRTIDIVREEAQGDHLGEVDI